MGFAAWSSHENREAEEHLSPKNKGEREDRGGGRKQRCLLQDKRGERERLSSRRDNKPEKRDRGRERGRGGEN